jgi:hypothetical protein
VSDIPEDVFGKIDALLGKRVGFAATKPEADALDDFPVLTEVVARDAAEELPSLQHPPAADTGPTSAAIPAEPAEVEPNEPIADLPDLGIIPPVCDFDLLDQFPVDPMEARLLEMIAHQQAQLEAMIRRVVREELERFRRDQ